MHLLSFVHEMECCEARRNRSRRIEGIIFGRNVYDVRCYRCSGARLGRSADVSGCAVRRFLDGASRNSCSGQYWNYAGDPVVVRYSSVPGAKIV
jgi:hypothetical protein